MASDPDIFPEDFCFGVATSAYQVEGGLNTDWTVWEAQGKLKEPHVRCGDAVDHWNRFDEDLRLLQHLGAQAFRLSIEWARLEPESGKFDPAAAQAYRWRLERLVAAGIRPVVTLHHFTHPTWFHETCPWHLPGCLPRWETHVRACIELARGLDVVWVTFNEPMVFLLGGYLDGQMPPGKKSGNEAGPALENIARAHVLAWRLIKEASPSTPVGIAQHLMAFAPDRWWHPLDQALCRIADSQFNWALLEAFSTGRLNVNMPGVMRARADLGAAATMDYVGANYYTRSHLKFIPGKPFVRMAFKDVSKRGLTDIGWEEFPEGFGLMLRQLKRFHLPVWVMENGIDDRRGERRPGYMYTHLKELLAARAAGVDIRAYLHWALLDNFEWLEGWGPKFGLYGVNRETMERIETPAVPYYRALIRTRRLVAP